jgi:GlpG protein
MRYLAQIEGKQQAETFVAYLLTQSVSTHIEGNADNDQLWDIWIRDEDALEQARAELAHFRSQPDDPKYAAAIPSARQIIRDKQAAQREAAKRVRPVNYRGTLATRGGGRIPPLTLTLLIICIAVSILTNFASPPANSKLGITMLDQLSFVKQRDYDNTRDPAYNLKRGEVWRAVTPAFLHGSPLHLAMNMFALVILGRLAEQLVGTPRYALMVLLLAALPMLLACLMPPALDGSPQTVGISGVIYGLASFLWLVARQRPDLGFQIPNGFITFMVIMILLGFAGVLTGISSWAHLGGFVVGLALALGYTQVPR